MKVCEIENCTDLIWWEWDSVSRYLSLQNAFWKTEPVGVKDHNGQPFRRPRWSRLYFWLREVLEKPWTKIMDEPFPAWIRVKNGCWICHELNQHCTHAPNRFPLSCQQSLGNILCVHQEDTNLMTIVERLVLIGKAQGWIDSNKANKILAQVLMTTDTGNRLDWIAVQANNFIESNGQIWSFFNYVQSEDSSYIFSPNVVHIINQTWFSFRRNFSSKEEFRRDILPLQNAFGNMVSRCLDDAKPVLKKMGQSELKKRMSADEICSHFNLGDLAGYVRSFYYNPEKLHGTN